MNDVQGGRGVALHQEMVLAPRVCDWMASLVQSSFLLVGVQGRSRTVMVTGKETKTVVLPEVATEINDKLLVWLPTLRANLWQTVDPEVYLCGSVTSNTVIPLLKRGCCCRCWCRCDG